MTESDDRVWGDVGTRLLLDNEQLRIWELKLEPGTTSDLHHHSLDYVMVQVAGDKVAARFEPDSEGTFAGAEFLEGDVVPGAAYFAEAGGRETAINTGEETFHEVVLELKRGGPAARDAAPSGLTVGAVIANVARATPSAIAAEIGGVAHTFAELDEAGDSVARHLVAAGYTPGQVALVFAPTSFEMLATYVGCARAGLVFAPLNPAFDEATIAAVAERIEPSVVLASDEFAEVASRLDVPTLWPATSPSTPEIGAVTLPIIAPTDPQIAFFTSGSTGVPKAAVVSHETIVLRSHPGSQLEPRGAALCPWPLFHMAGWTISLGQWHARGRVVFVDGTDAPTLATALREHRIERFNAIPALWLRLADHVGDRNGDDAAFPDLRFADTGTSPTSVELLATIADLAPNAHVRVFYGSSEAGNVASLHHDDLLTRPGSCGQPCVLTEARIGDAGELLLRGPLLFDGYLGDPEATAEALRDGWFHTGDRAEVDADGYLSIVGRLGTVIRTGGESVEPDVVEAALRTHPAIDEVVVFGLPDERWGEIVCAAVVATSPVSVADLRAHVGSDGPNPLPSHQHPRRVVAVDAIPRTSATGQVDRHRLRQLAADAAEETQ